MKRYWDDASKMEMLKALLKQGLSASEITDRLGGTTRNAVIGKIHRSGLRGDAAINNSGGRPKRKPTEAQKKFVGITKPKLTVTAAEVLEFQKLDEEPMRDDLVHIHDLEPHHCRAVYGEPRNTMYCGKEKVKGTSWCLHHLIKYMPGTALVTREAETEKVNELETA